MSNGAKKRLRSGAGQISEVAWAFLNDALTDDIGSGWERYGLEAGQPTFAKGPSARELWTTYGPIVLKRWKDEHPGTRPSLWWRFDAPRVSRGVYPSCFWDGKLPVPRERVGGVGRPLHETTAYVPSFYLGVPTCWVADADHLGLEHVALDPNDPPTFESQASYLKRLGLLLPGEGAKLLRSMFQPESVLEILSGMRALASDSRE